MEHDLQHGLDPCDPSPNERVCTPIPTHVCGCVRAHPHPQTHTHTQHTTDATNRQSKARSESGIPLRSHKSSAKGHLVTRHLSVAQDRGAASPRTPLVVADAVVGGLW